MAGLTSLKSEPLDLASPTKNITGGMSTLTLQAEVQAAVSSASSSSRAGLPAPENTDEAVSESEDDG